MSAFLRATLCLLSDRVARRLRRMEAGAMTVAVRYKLGFTRFSRQRRLAEPTQDGIHLTRIAWDLLEPARRGRALRLIGVAGCELAPCSQPPLLPDDIVRERLHHTGDRLRDRFGEGVLLPAETLRRRTRRGR